MHGRYFHLRWESKYDGGIVGVTFPLRQKFVGIGHRKCGGFMEPKLPSFGVLLSSGGQKFVTVFDLRRDHAMAICRDLHMDCAVNICNPCQWRIKRHLGRENIGRATPDCCATKDRLVSERAVNVMSASQSSLLFIASAPLPLSSVVRIPSS